MGTQRFRNDPARLRYSPARHPVLGSLSSATVVTYPVLLCTLLRRAAKRQKALLLRPRTSTGLNSISSSKASSNRARISKLSMLMNRGSTTGLPLSSCMACSKTLWVSEGALSSECPSARECRCGGRTRETCTGITRVVTEAQAAWCSQDAHDYLQAPNTDWGHPLGPPHLFVCDVHADQSWR